MTQNIRKGIILAGGLGTRLYPLTKIVSKQLLPVYDKPMIYYPLSTLMLSGIRDILIISTPSQLPSFKQLLGDGHNLGIKLQYKAQDKPNGLPEAYILAEEFLDNESSILILGDNIFYGHKLEAVLRNAMINNQGSTIFSYQVNNPQDYGVVEYEGSRVIDIIEKPVSPPSKYAITGMYICDHNAVNYAKSLQPSKRSELEIVDLLKKYIDRDKLKVNQLCRGIAWLDAGTQHDLLNASQYIAMLEERQGMKICCPEEIAWRKKFISDNAFNKCIQSLPQTSYSTYLKSLIEAHYVATKNKVAELV